MVELVTTEGSEPRPKIKTVTQSDVARIFTEQARNLYAYCHSQQSWLEWSGSIWRTLDKPDVYNQIGDLCDRMSVGAQNFSKMQEANWPGGVERKCKAKPAFSRSANDWDQDPFLVGTPKGVINIATGASEPSHPAQLITKSTAASPLAVSCPRWTTFLQEATGGDDDRIKFLQTFSGYCLTGDTREQCLVFIHGPGGRGKGVFKDTISAILGDYASVAPIGSFTSAKHDPHPTDMAKMRGSRLVTASETRKGSKWDDAKIKLLTGQDIISARFMGKDFFDYRPTFKILIVGNFPPEIENVDEAMKRRLFIVPFNAKPAVKDTLLFEKLKPEWPAILNWMVEGAQTWLKTGLHRAPSITAATDSYFDDQDILGHWIAATCDVDIGNPHVYEPTSRLFESWSAFAKAKGEDVGSMRTLSFRLQDIGFTKSKRERSTVRVMEGMQLRVTPSAD